MGVQNGTNALKIYLAIPFQKEPRIPLLGVCLSKGNKNKRPPKDLRKNTHNSQNMETTQMPLKKRINTQTVIYLYHMLPLSN